MTNRPPSCFTSRRIFLGGAGGLFAAVAAPVAAAAVDAAEPFFGAHQGGITTPQQRHTYFAALDVVAKTQGELAAMLRQWTEAAARMAEGQPAAPPDENADRPDADSGEALGLAPSRLSLTFGFGAGLFVHEGRDRYGLAAQRPQALVDLPAFHGEQLEPARTGGDISVQACADDPQVAFHAVRQLARVGGAAVRLRWAQTGFLPASPPGETPRNLMGFRDGTRNPNDRLDEVVWVGAEGPAWMRGGSYVVVRRIRIALEHWDRTELGFQEEVIGRHKRSGAPLGGIRERDTPDLNAVDSDGNPVIAETAHVRMAMPENNGGAAILRRGYSYNDGANFTAERWPPWRQGIEYDAGLLFVGYQRDPRSGFIRVFERMSQLDSLNQYTTHVGSGLFACPGGVARGGYIGQGLFEPA